MVSEISARHALFKEVIDGVSERTGGVPLFVEEVTRPLVERGEQGGAQAIPLTLQQSLAARLDRLGVAREVAPCQLASNFDARSASKIDPNGKGLEGSARRGEAGLGCAAGASAAR
jgi:hypothetical protein